MAACLLLVLGVSIAFPGAFSAYSAGHEIVGAQHWWESGWYADQGMKSHYDGYMCMCECTDSDEGTFCRGGGVKPDGVSQVAKFLGVWSEERDGTWSASLSAFNTTTPFADSFEMGTPGGPSNYTGVSQALGDASFVWRGYMSGVNCSFADKCEKLCGGATAFDEWSAACALLRATR